jgi:hypothetical protein
MEQINAIAINNGYIINDIKKYYEKHKRLKPIISTIETKIWTKLTYFGSDIKTLTKIF